MCGEIKLPCSGCGRVGSRWVGPGTNWDNRPEAEWLANQVIGPSWPAAPGWTHIGDEQFLCELCAVRDSHDRADWAMAIATFLENRGERAGTAQRIGRRLSYWMAREVQRRTTA